MSFSVDDAARRIAAAIDAREVKEKKTITRLQMSVKGLSFLCSRKVLTGDYMSQLASSCLEHGWCCFQISSTAYAFIRLDSATKFRKMSGEVLSELVDD